jgi:hypothetical protein
MDAVTITLGNNGVTLTIADNEGHTSATCGSARRPANGEKAGHDPAMGRRSPSKSSSNSSRPDRADRGRAGPRRIGRGGGGGCPAARGDAHRRRVEANIDDVKPVHHPRLVLPTNARSCSSSRQNIVRRLRRTRGKVHGQGSG